MSSHSFPTSQRLLALQSSAIWSSWRSSFLRHSCCLVSLSFIPLLHLACTLCFYPSIRDPTYNLVLALSLKTVSFVQYRNGVQSQPSSVGKILFESTIALGPLLQLSAATYGQKPIPILVYQCSDSLHFSLFYYRHADIPQDLYFLIHLKIHGLQFS
jgi:hypothetical protein